MSIITRTIDEHKENRNMEVMVVKDGSSNPEERKALREGRHYRARAPAFGDGRISRRRSDLAPM
jgi:hypothetical protein